MPPKYEKKYFSALSKLNKISMFGPKPGLERITKLLFLLENPQKKFKCILVGGTNGKGSTTKFLANILEGAGCKTGSFYSPPIFSFRERIQINGMPISKKDFVLEFEEVTGQAKKMSADMPSFFEIMAAMAFLHFAKKKADYAVLEVGLGGRLDATNACEPMVSIICSIGLEHTVHLGNTVEKISFEKAGIMRKGKPAVCGAEGEAKIFLRAQAVSKGAKFILPSKKFLGAKLSTAGIFQKKNAALAGTAASLLGIGDGIIFPSLEKTKIPARWEKISNSPSLTIDCCHNPPAAKGIISDLKKYFVRDKNSPRILVFGAMKDKDYKSVLKIILPFFDGAVFCSPPYERAEKSGKLLQCAKKICNAKGEQIKLFSVSNPDLALSKSEKLAGKNGRILCTGSIYLLQFLFGEHEFRMSG